MQQKTALQRFEEKYIIDPLTGCWLWIGAINENGYGLFWHEGKWGKAHRASYELYVGPIPQGRELDHLCRIRRCVNWVHVEPVTRRVNLLRGDTIVAENARKTT